MESKIIITQEIVANASDYMPLQLKIEIAERIAQDCIARVAMTRITKGGFREALPDRCQERQLNTNLYLMGVLASWYLHIPYDGEHDTTDDNPYYGLMMPANTYDLFAGSHIINQLEKLKGDKECRDKVFNILCDYRQFQRILYDEIRCIVEHRNDVVWRLLEALEKDVETAIANGMADALGEQSQQEDSASAIESASQKLRDFLEKKEKLDELAALFSERLEKLKELQDSGEPVHDGE